MENVRKACKTRKIKNVYAYSGISRWAMQCSLWGESLWYGATLYNSVHFISRSSFLFNLSFWYQRLNIVFKTIIWQDGLDYAVVMNNPKTWYMTKCILFPFIECPSGRIGEDSIRVGICLPRPLKDPGSHRLLLNMCVHDHHDRWKRTHQIMH